MNRSADVVVLGAGPAGLAAGWWAARRGYSVVVLERATAVGGLAASFDVAGVRVDHGSHRLHPSIAPAILAELRTLLGDDLQRRTRRGRLRLGDGWVGFPPSVTDVAVHAPGLALRLVADAVASPFRRPGADTYAEVVRAGVGPTLGAALYFPYARKLWGLGPEELDGEQARRRIRASSPAAIARRVLRRGDDGRHFFYPRRGFGQISEALAEAAAAAGADVRTGADVVAVDVADDDCVRLSTAAGDAVEGGVVLSTIPVGALVARVAPAAPVEVAAAAAALRSRAMVLVYLALDVARWTPFDAHYLPSPAVAPSRVSEPRNYRDAPGEDPEGRTVLCAEIPCWPGDDVWSATDTALAGRVVEDLAALGLPPASPTGTAVRRVASVYPVYDIGFARRLAAVEGWLGQRRRVLTLGRQGLFAHDNTHHTLDTAWAAVAALDGAGGIRRRQWSADRQRFRAHVVED